ncbi:hypothetical protein H8F21_15550 [Pseudomonas sp. P66]|uniref:PEP-utilising enzyme mobile domain-containing protein n=1 Tax=Pseudomonas arcuscaelestis TaxID=2710591 RepID=A0ABS2BZC4_9PSED|nr:PEP-utilizing enzyme [Pseudomonas arcuscaelestis]MBM5458982.1 hypothetical protein [Pseudomonas arcuscaelestis]
MSRLWLFLLVLVAVQAQAFPVVLAGAGTLVFGSAFVPLLAVALALFLGVKLWRLPRAALVASALAGFAAFALVSVKWSESNREEILATTQSLGAPAERTTDIPYPYVSDADQAISTSRMAPADFYGLIGKRSIRVIRVDFGAQLFTDFGFGATASQIHDNPAPIVELAKRPGQGVVLVDERGTTAAAIADALNAQFGTQIRFLQGGANALSNYAWEHLDRTGDPRAVLPSEIPAFKASRAPVILSTTNPDEFLDYGWIHGLTLSLPVFLSGADSIAAQLQGKTVLITAAESHFSGDTWILLDMLRARGIDPYFMQPTRDELLEKPAYFKPYKNADRYIGADQTFTYVVGNPSVQFLDFQPSADWARTKNRLPRTVHIDMELVAKGGLDKALSKLDKTGAYVGLAYDRRTFYHSILAGELLTSSGVKWLGTNTQPGLFNRAVLVDQDLIDPAATVQARLQQSAVSALGGVYSAFPGSAAWVLCINFAVCFVGALLAMQCRNFAGRIFVLTAFALVTYGLWIAYLETTVVWVSEDFISITQIMGAILGWWIVRFHRRSHRFGRQSEISVLPAKIDLLERAASLGHRVEKGFVVTSEQVGLLPSWVVAGPVIVRSAALSESSSAHTVGIYESISAVGEQAVRLAIANVRLQIAEAGETPFCLIQPLLTHQVFGVAMFGTASDGHLFICEAGMGGAATGGTGCTERVAVPLWRTAGLSNTTRKVRRALINLNRDLGATTIEWAMCARGKLTILQVSTDTLRRPALERLLKHTGTGRQAFHRYQCLPLEHRSAVGAAVVATMAAPGDQYSLGGLRVARSRSFVAARSLQLVDIVTVLGSLPRTAFSRVPGQLLLEAFESADRTRDDLRRTVQIALSAPEKALAQAIASELAQVSKLYGRFGRIATTALELKIESPVPGFKRQLISTVIGSELSQLHPAAAAESISAVGYAAVTCFSPGQDPSIDPELVSPVIQEVDSPLAWIKDKCAVMMMIELGRLRPAINELCQRGAGESLLSLLPAYLGELPAGFDVAGGPRSVRELLDGACSASRQAPSVFAWGVPRRGLELTLNSPDNYTPGSAVYLETTDMSQLALVQGAGALLVRSGSSLSHLLQHARRLNVPYVVGVNDVADLIGGPVRIQETGEVLRA